MSKGCSKIVIKMHHLELLHFSEVFTFVSSVLPIFKNVGEQSTAKSYCPVRLLSVIGKVFEKFS